MHGVKLVFAQLNATADGVSYCLQHLVMEQPVPPPLPELLGSLRCTPRNLFSGTVSMQGCCLTPAVQIGWALENIIHCLDQKLESSWF